MPKADRFESLNHGLPEQDGLDEGGKQALMRQLAPRQPHVVGNLADVQRAGAAILKGEANDLAAGVEAPPGTTPGSIKAAAKVEEKVEKALASASDAVADAAATAEKEQAKADKAAGKTK